jgi:hypothetical protein
MDDETRRSDDAAPEDDTEGQALRRTDDDNDDTEGHILPVNPTVADMLARNRAAEVDRGARSRIFRRDVRDSRKGR